MWGCNRTNTTIRLVQVPPCEDWLTNRVVGRPEPAGWRVWMTCCVRIGSQSGGCASGIGGLTVADDVLCEDSLTKWVVGRPELADRQSRLACYPASRI